MSIGRLGQDWCCKGCRSGGLLPMCSSFWYNTGMAFSQIHDEWIRKGLVDAAFALHVVPCGKGSWGQVEHLPVDVYFCDFQQYDPPLGLPVRHICCIRTNAAWWIILAKPVFDHVQQCAQDGELPKGLANTLRVINERQIGAWLLVRDRDMPGEQALKHMDLSLLEKYGQDYRVVMDILVHETSTDPERGQFDDQDFGKEPLEADSLEDINPVLKEAADQRTARSQRRIRGKHLLTRFHPLDLYRRVKIAGVWVLLVVVLIVECPRLWRLSVDVYGPPTVDLEASFPTIRWIDRTSESVMSAPHVSRCLYQAVSYRNPFKVAGSIVEVSVRDDQTHDASSVYRWEIALDGTGTQDEITVRMAHLSKKEMRRLQNTLSGYKSQKFILACKLFMTWGHDGRFVLICTGLCVAGMGLLIRRVVRRIQGIESDMTIRGVAAHGKILESVAQDAQAAENLMRFNQDRRLRLHDKGPAPPWEREAFDWVELQIDPDTGQTKRKQRDGRLKQTRHRHRSCRG